MPKKSLNSLVSSSYVAIKKATSAPKASRPKSPSSSSSSLSPSSSSSALGPATRKGVEIVRSKKSPQEADKAVEQLGKGLIPTKWIDMFLGSQGWLRNDTDFAAQAITPGTAETMEEKMFRVSPINTHRIQEFYRKQKGLYGNSSAVPFGYYNS